MPNLTKLTDVPSFALSTPIYTKDGVNFYEDGLGFKFSRDERFAILDERSGLAPGYLFQDVVRNRLDLPLKQRVNFGTYTEADVRMGTGRGRYHTRSVGSRRALSQGHLRPIFTGLSSPPHSCDAAISYASLFHCVCGDHVGEMCERCRCAEDVRP